PLGSDLIVRETVRLKYVWRVGPGDIARAAASAGPIASGYSHVCHGIFIEMVVSTYDPSCLPLIGTTRARCRATSKYSAGFWCAISFDVRCVANARAKINAFVQSVIDVSKSGPFLEHPVSVLNL